jgi:dienelactone hydrolase
MRYMRNSLKISSGPRAGTVGGLLLALGASLLAPACSSDSEDPIPEIPVLPGAPGSGIATDAGAPTVPFAGSDASVTGIPSTPGTGVKTTSPSGGDAGTTPSAAGDGSVATLDAGPSTPATTPDAGGSGTTGGTTPTGGASCLDGITDFEKAGPFKYKAQTSGNIKFWVPEVPAGCKVPVVHLANGTTANCGNYQDVLNRFASHGFLTACYESPDTGAGTQGVQAFTKALEMFPEIADMRLGSTGHSQGGQAAFTVLQQSEAKWGDKAIYAGLAMQPASGFGEQPPGGSWQSMYAKIKSPMFMFSGTADVLVSESWVSQAFSALDDSIEAYWWSANGATHIPTPQEPTMQVGVSWFRWKLLGDKAACAAFKKLPDGDGWDERKSQHPVDCK